MKQENYYFLSDKYCPVDFLTINPKRRRHVINMASIDANILLSDQHSKQLLPNTVFELIFGAFGVSGNSIVLLMYTRFITDKSGTRYFIPILALVDLTGCVSSVTSFYLDNTMGYVYPSANLCKIMMFLIIISGGFSAHLIFAIALQRYLLICRPFGQQMTQAYRRIAVLAIFLFSLGYAAPFLKFAGLRETSKLYTEGNGTREISVSFCYFDDGSYGSPVMVPYFGALLLLSFINIIVTSGLYIPVTRTIYRTLSPFNRAAYWTNHLKNGETTVTSLDDQNTLSEIPRQDLPVMQSCPEPQISSSSSFERVTPEISQEDLTKTTNCSDSQNTVTICQESNRKQQTRRKLSIMFLLIIIVYVLSYLTSLVTQIYTFATEPNLTGYRLNIYALFLRINLLNHIANPYIYWFYDVKFRGELNKLCCRSLRENSSNIK